jgi:hypothetical protein
MDLHREQFCGKMPYMANKIDPKPLLLIRPFDNPRPEPLKFSFPKPPEKEHSLNLSNWPQFTQLKSPPLSPVIKSLNIKDIKDS